MTKKTAYRHNEVGNFSAGELLPIKNCWFRIAHVEPGVLILALDGFTQAGIEALARIKAELALERKGEQQQDAIEAHKDLKG